MKSGPWPRKAEPFLIALSPSAETKAWRNAGDGALLIRMSSGAETLSAAYAPAASRIIPTWRRKRIPLQRTKRTTQQPHDRRRNHQAGVRRLTSFARREYTWQRSAIRPN